MNIYDKIPESITEEIIEIMYQNPHCKVERIISNGQITTENEWYDQDQEEWIILVQGEATILIEKLQEESSDKCNILNCNIKEESCDKVHMVKGDTLLIKSHQKHRVIYTSQNPLCIWLCVFVDNIK